MSGDYDQWEPGPWGDPWARMRQPLPAEPRPGEFNSAEMRRRRENFLEWARSDDPVKRFRAAHGGWDGWSGTSRLALPTPRSGPPAALSLAGRVRERANVTPIAGKSRW